MRSAFVIYTRLGEEIIDAIPLPGELLCGSRQLGRLPLELIEKHAVSFELVLVEIAEDLEVAD